MQTVVGPHLRKCLCKEQNQGEACLQFRDPGVPPTLEGWCCGLHTWSESSEHWGFPTHVHPSTLAVTVPLTRQFPYWPLLPTGSIFQLYQMVADLFLPSRKRRRLVLKLHTLWPQPPDPLLHSWSKQIVSLIWHFLPPFLQTWEIFMASH